MLKVKAVAGESSISGIGLFAVEFIPKDTIVWEFDKNVDESFTKEEVENLPEPKRTEIESLYFAYVSKQTGLYINCGDDAKYTNHSSLPNIGTKQGEFEEICYALRDIQKGEEITQNYNDFADVEFGFKVNK